MTGSFGPFVGNTHSESSETGQLMTRAYHLAHEVIKGHVNASAGDVLITVRRGDDRRGLQVAADPRAAPA